MVFYKIPQLGYWFPFRLLVGLCNTPLIAKTYVINHSTFLGYLEKGIVVSLHPSNHEQYPSNNVGQNESTHGVLHSTPMRVLLSTIVWITISWIPEKWALHVFGLHNVGYCS